MGNGFMSIAFTQIDDMKGQLTTDRALLALLDTIYDHLEDDESVVLMVKKNCTVVCTRKKGHGDRILKKFTNVGFVDDDAKTDSRAAQGLADAIRNIADDLPSYCYDAIKGDKAAIRKTTEHLFRVYRKKAERMKEKGKPAPEIASVLARQDEIARYLELKDDELVRMIDMLIIEIPKNVANFESIDEMAAISGKN